MYASGALQTSPATRRFLFAISVQQQIGIANKYARLRYLAEYRQSRVAATPRIRLLTPSSPARSMGFAAFAVDGMPGKTVTDRLRERHRVNVQSKAEPPYKPFREAVRVTPQPYTTVGETRSVCGSGDLVDCGMSTGIDQTVVVTPRMIPLDRRRKRTRHTQ